MLLHCVVGFRGVFVVETYDEKKHEVFFSCFYILFYFTYISYVRGTRMIITCAKNVHVVRNLIKIKNKTFFDTKVRSKFKKVHPHAPMTCWYSNTCIVYVVVLNTIFVAANHVPSTWLFYMCVFRTLAPCAWWIIENRVFINYFSILFLFRTEVVINNNNNNIVSGARCSKFNCYA